VHIISRGTVSIYFNTFVNQNNFMDQANNKGGCLSIDSSSGELNLYIKDSVFRQCRTRDHGGCIYLTVSSE
jgi:hypothetical protein